IERHELVQIVLKAGYGAMPFLKGMDEVEQMEQSGLRQRLPVLFRTLEGYRPHGIIPPKRRDGRHDVLYVLNRAVRVINVSFQYLCLTHACALGSCRRDALEFLLQARHQRVESASLHYGLE